MRQRASPRLDPRWLTVSARDDLDKLTRLGRDRTRILAGLGYLRNEVFRDKASKSPSRVEANQLLSRRQVKAIVRCFEVAKAKVERLIGPLAGLPTFVDSPIDFDTLDRRRDPDGVFRPELRDVS